MLTTEFFRDGEETSINAQEGVEPPAVEYHYPEWDYQLQAERPDWVTVLEVAPERGDPRLITAILQRERRVLGRLRGVVEALTPTGLRRVRRQEEGDDVDLDDAVDALVDARLGRAPDLRVMVQTRRSVRDIAVLLLVDVSASTSDLVVGTELSVLELARDATVVLADALDRIGDPFAIHGFDSNSRHAVQYRRYKDFDEPWGTRVHARLAAMRAQRSTRMGAAIRHAGALLATRPNSRRLLLVLTDGEPSDNDVRDPLYLRFDARHAVESVGRLGVHTFCLSLDPRADSYVTQIFGPYGATVLDNVARLPERLPLLYAALTR